MSLDTNNNLQDEARKEHGQLTPEPSVEPKHLKSNGPSAQPSSDVNTSAESAGQSNPIKSEPEESEPGSSITGDVSQTALPISGSSRTPRHPTINPEQAEGATTGNNQPPAEVGDLQALEIDRIMTADPKLAFKILGLAGFDTKDKAEAQHQELVKLLRNCGHPKASEAIERLDKAIIPYRSVEPVTTGADFVDAHGDPMETDGNDSQGNDSNTENDSSSIFVPEDEQMRTSESTDGEALDTKEAWPWATGLTHDGKRIMAYRTQGRGHRAIVEPEKYSEVFDIRSGMECGGLEMMRYLAQEGILQLKPPATRRNWSYKHRGDFVKLCYLATSDYKTHNKDSKSGGRRKDPEAWGFVQWTWGFEEIVVSDLRKVIGRESADAAIRAICKKSNHTAPMEKRPQQIIVKTTRIKGTQLDTGLGRDFQHVSGSSKPAVSDVAEQRLETKTEQVKPEAGFELSSVLSEINKKLDLLEEKVDKVDELSNSTAILSQIVAKLAQQVGLKMDS
ncbi:hypothetical protein G6011_09550 [Alternaria panax]|uniref:Uncharacterized protein n=1 Tax=Alternaria panax TaxID=48097 RepID=A0AAD4FAF3_9PLEO|nr:hypothetical protein G6011_09550 [Alternaria panax]